jgi:ubiquinone biosynthesis protein UbiJ
MDPQRQSLIPVFLTEQLERAANRALHYAPVTRLQLAKLKGKSLAIELQRPNFPLQMSVGRRALSFRSHWEHPADVTIRGPAIALLRQIGRADTSPADLMQLGIEVEGDQQLAQQFLTILKDLDLDLESALGDLIGDMAAHQISEVARAGFSWLRSTAKTVLAQSRQLVAEERQWVLTPREFKRFQDDIDELREDTDRLQARMQRLQSTLSPSQSTQQQDDVNP